MSLDTVARRTETSKAMLGQIERGESSPTIATLWKIATGLDVSLSYFLSAPPSADADRLDRSKAHGWHGDDAGMRTRPLSAFDPALGFEMFAVEFAPGATSLSSAHAPSTVEHLVVLSGELEITLEDKTFILGAGDVLRFAADRAHRYTNTSAELAYAHDLIHYPR